MDIGRPDKGLRHDPGITTLEHRCDVCVVGGGMAGLCAGIASARTGASTVLLQDRPVLGGNASSEVRMWICGAHGKGNKETGILEEIQLENLHRNPSLNYNIWDSVLYGKAVAEPNLTLLLNAAVCDGQGQAGRLDTVRAWQTTTQTWHIVEARQFVDASGDSILAPISGAITRWGREARSEFDEDIEPADSDGKTMGNTILIQLRQTDQPQRLIAPDWAMRIDSPEDVPFRLRNFKGNNFWWLEIGGLHDTIRDAETIRHELMRLAWGTLDYIKNRSPMRAEAQTWAVEFVGSLPGKRESRRYEGAHIMTQHDVRGGAGHFDDVVAFGGWSMDDHHPAGIFYPGKPTIFHPAPSPYDIPLRSLYSASVANLWCAGRNISVTHAALSSTRVMATCAVIGQAVGTAAALCATENRTSESLTTGRDLRRLQQMLMDGDAWLPGRTRDIDELARAAKLSADHGNAEVLIDGHDRDREDSGHSWRGPVGSAIEFAWESPVNVGGLRLTLDSNLANDKRMPCSYPQKGDRCLVPNSLLRTLRVEAKQGDGTWAPAGRIEDNYQRLVRLPINMVTAGLRLIPEATWGSDEAIIVSAEPTTDPPQTAVSDLAKPVSLRSCRDVIADADLAPPECEDTSQTQKQRPAHGA